VRGEEKKGKQGGNAQETNPPNIFRKEKRTRATSDNHTLICFAFAILLDLPESLQSKIPLGRFGTADEVADAAAFLARNPYANNCILNLDGGLSAT